MPNNYILTSDGSFVSEDELYHYGVLGMKWGVHRQKSIGRSITRHQKQNAKLERKAAKYDVKASKQQLKNVKKGYEPSGLIANKKSSKLNVKAAKLERKAVKLDKNSTEYLRTKRKASKKKLQSLKSMNISDLSTKKDYKYQINAAKARYKIENNNLRIDHLNERSIRLAQRLLENDKD